MSVLEHGKTESTTRSDSSIMTSVVTNNIDNFTTVYGPPPAKRIYRCKGCGKTIDDRMDYSTKNKKCDNCGSDSIELDTIDYMFGNPKVVEKYKDGTIVETVREFEVRNEHDIIKIVNEITASRTSSIKKITITYDEKTKRPFETDTSCSTYTSSTVSEASSCATSTTVSSSVSHAVSDCTTS